MNLHSFDEILGRLQGLIEAPPPPTAARGCSVLCTEQASRRLLILDAERDWNGKEALRWSWSPDDHPELPVKEKWWFDSISEAKATAGGGKILAVASGGGVVLVDRKTGDADFCGYAGGNTHSAELLPDGNIAAVSSTGGFISLFHVEEGEVEPVGSPCRLPFPDAHGVVWDPWQELLWVQGHWELASFRYRGGKEAPSLEKVDSIPLPEEAWNGHDLSFVPDSRVLFLTSTRRISLFDTAGRRLRPLADIPFVKSISLNRWGDDGALIVQIPKESWWSDEILLLAEGRPAIGRLDGARFYKARFL